MPFTLPALPFEKNAFEPYISARTFDFHHGKHHQAYVTNLNSLIAGTPLETQPLEEIIQATAKEEEKAGIFNNAAQTWNHSFFWNSLALDSAPSASLLATIEKSFGSLEGFKDTFKKAATTQFGSGWAWLVLEDGKMKVAKTSNAMTPLVQNQKPLLTCDVWEHAYYLDYQNRRPDFVQTFLDHLVNWAFVEKNLEA